jgi:magnesium transporter
VRNEQTARTSRRGSDSPDPARSAGPATLTPAATPPSLRAIAYGPQGSIEEAIGDLARLDELRAAWPVTWVNAEGFADEESLAGLGARFGLHRLALEDVVQTNQRAKIEHYENYLFLILRMPLTGERLWTEQFSLFLGKGFVLTFQEGRPGDCFDPVREQIRKGVGRLREAGPDHLAYALLDAVIDAYFPVLEAYGESLEDLEEDLLWDPRRQSVIQIHAIKRDLLTLRRAIWPLRDVIGLLLREEPAFILPETHPYLRDCYDHIVQIIDLVETYRELTSSMMDVYLSSVSNRMNEIMKVLTVISTIFIPLSFIAGVYGMNFNPQASPLNMPELNWAWGYPLCLGLMGCVAGALVVYFWRRGWLSGDAHSSTLPRPRVEEGEE